jgi:hypothetical protein
MRCAHSQPCLNEGDLHAKSGAANHLTRGNWRGDQDQGKQEGRISRVQGTEVCGIAALC